MSKLSKAERVIAAMIGLLCFMLILAFVHPGTARGVAEFLLGVFVGIMLTESKGKG